MDDGYVEDGMIQDASMSLSAPMRSKPTVFRSKRSFLSLRRASFLSSESGFTTI